MRIFLVLMVVVFGVTPTPVSAQATSVDNKQLQKALARYPRADVNQDGVLTLGEARAYQKRLGATDKQAAPPQTETPAPTHENVRYGAYDRNVFDLWLPESQTPTALIVFIHGGGFTGGSKEKIRSSPNVRQALGRGVAFASIQYRFIHEGDDLGDPQRTGIQHVLRDSARAIQFMRSKAADYNLDKRVIAYGGSAGAGTSIWLAFHDDLADPANPDPVLRESSRLTAAGMLAGQFTYDVTQWDDYFKGGDIQKTHGDGSAQRNFGRFFGLDAETYDGPVGQGWRADVDMHGLISPDDPPVFAITTNPDVPPSTRGIYNHHPRHARLIEQRCQAEGVEVLCLVPKVRPADDQRLKANPEIMMDFFFDKLGLLPAQ